jgi:altronate dehydratase
MALYKRTMISYMLHPMVRFGVFLEHGCELTHNDAMRHRLVQLGGDPAEFGWASIQLDGGMERVMAKVEEWFAERLAKAPPLRRELVVLQHARIGIMASAAPPAQVSAALADVARNILVQGGTIVLPSTAPLLATRPFADEILGAQGGRITPEPTLAYGQFAAKPGLHLMDAPSQHWVETLSGLGATGVELVLAYVDAFPQQAHPFIPVLQFTHRAQLGATLSREIDLVLQGGADESAAEIEAGMLRMLAGKLVPRANALGNRDFQITRARLGVTV